MMGQAFALAQLNHGLTGDNPSVGCVLLDADGHVVAEGVTGVGGRPHAEEVALDAARDRATGGTAYVTLEPCRSRTAGAEACSSRLVQAGVRRVVCAIADPHPTAAGGFNVLKSADVQVEVGLKRRQGERLYRNFFQRISG